MQYPQYKTAARRRVQTPDGVVVSAQEWGNAAGPPILLIHGISQCHLSWMRQMTGELAARFRLITYDLRGHGESAKPLEPHYYRESGHWGDEVKAVMEAFGLERPVLVGWSYGGRIVCEYLLTHGDDAIGGVNFVGASTAPPPGGPTAGAQQLLGMTAEDPALRSESTRRFLRLCTAQPLPADEFETMLAFNMATPWQVRSAMWGRAMPYEAALRGLRVPALVTHGELDAVVHPAVGRHTLATAPRATGSFYEGVGHMPFWEAAERFNRELAEFVAMIKG